MTDREVSRNEDVEGWLRPARPGEGAALLMVARASVNGLARGHYDPGQIAGWIGDRTADYYEPAIARGGVTVLETGGRVVGFVDAARGQIVRLFVLPSHVRRGIGARLLRAGIETARRDHRGPVRVEATLNAEGFYLRHGFRRRAAGFHRGRGGGAPVPVVFMELR